MGGGSPNPPVFAFGPRLRHTYVDQEILPASPTLCAEIRLPCGERLLDSRQAQKAHAGSPLPSDCQTYPQPRLRVARRIRCSLPVVPLTAPRKTIEIFLLRFISASSGNPRSKTGGLQIILQLILINATDLLRLNAEVVQRLSLCAVIETDHEFWQSSSECHALMISPGLPKSMASIISI
jgi:hypothetical protein